MPYCLVWHDPLYYMGMSAFGDISLSIEGG